MLRNALLASVAALFLAGCNSSSSSSTAATGTIAPVYAQSGVWTLAYSPGVSLNGTSFDFPGGTSGADYLIEGPTQPVSPGQTITAVFTLEGDGVLAATEGTVAPQVRLFFQRKGDNLSAQGDYASYRWWSVSSVELKSPGTFTLSEVLTTDRWTNVNGKSGSENADLFAAAIANMGNVGMTFGGEFYGHGVVCSSGSVKFTIQSFTIG